MKQRAINLILVLILIVGLSLLLYPTVSNWWNSMHQTRAISSYNEVVEQTDPDTYEKIRADARRYNATLVGKGDSRFVLSEQEQRTYDALLDPTGEGIMAVAEVPDLQVQFAVYHGTDESVLQTAIGHIEGTSLPVGGESTHCALSGHRGLPSARLFTDLDKLAVGDRFLIHILDETLTYEVDRISIVLPHELEELAIVDGEDYCTLITCTPYGINSHRLLVRGTRVETQEEEKVVRVTADAMRVDPLLVAPVLAAPLLILLLFVVLFSKRNKK